MSDFTLLLLFSIVTIFIFRIIPFSFKNNKYLNDKDSFIYKTISYSTQAMIGIIVYNSAFSGKDISQLATHIDSKDLVKIIFLIMTFILTIKTKKIIPSFLLFLALYTVYVYLTT